MLAGYIPHMWWKLSTGFMVTGTYRHTWVNRTVAALIVRGYNEQQTLTYVSNKSDITPARGRIGLAFEGSLIQ